MAKKCSECKKKLSNKLFTQSNTICDTCYAELEKKRLAKESRRRRYQAKKEIEEKPFLHDESTVVENDDTE